jgi:uncharacterized membrane protein YqjE
MPLRALGRPQSYRMNRLVETHDGTRNPSTSLRDGAVAMVNLYRTRFELLLLDLEEEKERLEQRFILSAGAVFLFGLGSLVATGFFVALLWEPMGVWAIGLFAILYLGGAGALVMVLRRLNRDRHRTFACTLREFEKDAERFARVLDHHSDSIPSGP